jgi:hypothetical protein
MGSHFAAGDSFMHAGKFGRTTLIPILVWTLCLGDPVGRSQPTSDPTGAQTSATQEGLSLGTGTKVEPATRGAYRARTPEPYLPFSRIGAEGHSGLGGIGFNAATPLARHFSLRAGADFFSYDTTFKDQGARIQANLRMRTGHGNLDWFPFANRFRLSPMIVFANNNRVGATYLIPAGNTITLNGQDYVSSSSDPLHGAGSVDFRKASPGFTVGFGNVSRRAKHFSTQLEAGFYYVGQPSLKVSFSGSACYPGLPESIACLPASSDPVFQKDLNAFIVRNRHNLSYASIFPVFTVGVGYAF